MNARTSLLLTCLLLAACAGTLRRGGQPVPALQTGSAEEALSELVKRREAGRPIAASMRIRLITPEKSTTFRARLLLKPAEMEMTAFTPIGTPAFTIRASGQQVEVRDHISGETMRGAEDVARRIGVFAPSLTAVDMAYLLLGFPVGAAEVEATPTGLARASVDDLAIEFNPPVHPPRQAVAVRGTQRAEIEFLEVVW